MSLEEKVDGLTAAIVELTAVFDDWRNTPVEGPALTEKASEPSDTPSPEEKAPPKKKKATPKKKATKPTPEQTPSAGTNALQGLITEVGAIAAKLGPRVTELTAMLGNEKYHSVKMSELEPALYADFLADCQKFLEPDA